MAILNTVIQAGTNAARPAASASNEAHLYFETDTLKTFRSNGSSWVQIAGGVGEVPTINADLDFNSHKGINLTDPSSAQDAATKAYVDGLAANLGKRARVRASTTANITISTALNNGDTLDGVTLATGDLVLVKNQSSAAENGVYVVGVSPARSSEFDAYDEHPGSLIAVEEGTAGADTLWLCTSNVGGTLNTTAIDFSQFVVSSGVSRSGSTTDGNLAVWNGNNADSIKDGGKPARVLISEATPSGTGTVTFSSIPGTYKTLEIDFVARSTKAASNNENMGMEFNGDATAANYRRTYNQAYGAGTNAASGADDNLIASLPAASAPANSPAVGRIVIPFYALTTFNKSGFSQITHRYDNTSVQENLMLFGVEWENAAAITQIVLKLASGNYVAGSTFRLYGVN